MRVLSRFALVVVLAAFTATPLLAGHLTGECALSLVASNPATTEFHGSAHGVFRSGNLVHILRGQTLTTFNVNDVGEMQVVRVDELGELGAREDAGAAAFSNGYLYVSGESGLEVYNLTDVRAGGTAPELVTRVPGFHYRRMAANGSVLAGLFPATDLPCQPTGTSFCSNQVDLFNITTPGNPSYISSINSRATTWLGFNDVAFNNGLLFLASEGALVGYNINNAFAPVATVSYPIRTTFLASNGAGSLAAGNGSVIHMFSVAPAGGLGLRAIFTLPAETFDRANPIAFHPEAWIDEQNGRLITMIDEINPQTLKPARTIAFDVFDMTVPMWEGSYERGYETITYTTTDEVKYNPVAVGPLVYTVGELSGLETWGACGSLAGGIELDSTGTLPCEGAQIHGWVTGSQRVANVELFLDGNSLGFATFGGALRRDISSRTPVTSWHVPVSLAQTARGEHVLRAVGTDALGVTRQFASKRVFFNGPGSNCFTRRRAAGASRSR